MRATLSLLCAGLFVALAGSANAAPITFEFQGVGSGTVYHADTDTTVPFANTLLGATLTGDTSQFENPLVYLGTPLSTVVGYGTASGFAGTFSVAGFPVGDLQDDVYVFLNLGQPIPLIGFGDTVDGDIFGLYVPGLSYDMQSPLAFVSGFTYFPGPSTIKLSNGDIVTLDEMHDTTIHPNVTATVTAVPEPSIAALVLMGVAGWRARRRRA